MAQEGRRLGARSRRASRFVARVHADDAVRRQAGLPHACPGSRHTAASIAGRGASLGARSLPVSLPRLQEPIRPPDRDGRDGSLYAAWLDGFTPGVTFRRSDDGGRSWTKPIHVDKRLAWSDKPIVAVSGDGKDVYVAFNGPTDGDA